MGYKAQEVAILSLDGSKHPIDYGVMVHNTPRWGSNPQKWNGYQGSRIKVRILINQQILE
jgi:hypothetical protein